MSTPQDPNGTADRSRGSQAGDPRPSQSESNSSSHLGDDLYGSASGQSSQAQGQHQSVHPQPGQYQPGQPQGQHQSDPYSAANAAQYQSGQYPSHPYAADTPGPYVAQQGQNPYGGQGANPGQGKRPGFFKSLFDFRFDDFIAVRWAGIIYIITIVIAVLSWIGTILSSIMVGLAASAATTFYSGDFYTDAPGFNPWPLILAILLGWIVPLLWVIFVRLVLELVVSSVRTAQHTRRIADSVGR
ncbi:uncharacterized protein DUF4282 [Brevibacterium sanguinis]|uniref:Uncharacterized protein DUF4282 n=2 Tax=Brevibacterium TaxID=1696 RepID=A0A366INI3_9MICO|nr:MULTISPECIES: DUF4282 domain-containing protein [Brevibacterium]RBP67958.1 uncharacterized protein DUF4282 [Brevibacterium sanguinis]RBP74625.1 uncharacterized protein DUF4282 [Brevibacterium celere]